MNTSGSLLLAARRRHPRPPPAAACCRPPAGLWDMACHNQNHPTSGPAGAHDGGCSAIALQQARHQRGGGGPLAPQRQAVDGLPHPGLGAGLVLDRGPGQPPRSPLVCRWGPLASAQRLLHASPCCSAGPYTFHRRRAHAGGEHEQGHARQLAGHQTRPTEPASPRRRGPRHGALQQGVDSWRPRGAAPPEAGAGGAARRRQRGGARRHVRCPGRGAQLPAGLLPEPGRLLGGAGEALRPGGARPARRPPPAQGALTWPLAGCAAWPGMPARWL